MIVLDASAAFELLSRSGAGDRIAQRIRAEDTQSPHLIAVEVASTIRRYAATGQISGSHGALMLGRFRSLPLTHHDHDVLLPRIWELRHNLSAYDATYVALAEQLGVPLITSDARMADAPGNTATVELFER